MSSDSTRRGESNGQPRFPFHNPSECPRRDIAFRMTRRAIIPRHACAQITEYARNSGSSWSSIPVNRAAGVFCACSACTETAPFSLLLPDVRKLAAGLPSALGHGVDPAFSIRRFMSMFDMKICRIPLLELLTIFPLDL
ncbi:hypothetical protein [Burkholderia ubonensis]|uniref:hypothetical protein n=1 Tax=Burkholderia ubonensis TaxID=101571 RepID=UPI002AB17E12|nr:hypothetical protein [Burkholderia ubonensis]